MKGCPEDVGSAFDFPCQFLILKTFWSRPLPPQTPLFHPTNSFFRQGKLWLPSAAWPRVPLTSSFRLWCPF